MTHNILPGQLLQRSTVQNKKLSVKPQLESVEKSEFGKLLQKNLDAELKFSKHAQKRLFSREIQMAEKELKSLKEVVEKLKLKGARESLVLMNRKNKDNLALLVSVRNKTVITAMNSENMRDNIFTNIDSTVVL